MLVEVHGASTVRLFGSLAGGGFREMSDVDLAVEGLDESRYFAALADLMALFDGPVNIGPHGIRIRFAPGQNAVEGQAV